MGEYFYCSSSWFDVQDTADMTSNVVTAHTIARFPFVAGRKMKDSVIHVGMHTTKKAANRLRMVTSFDCYVKAQFFFDLQDSAILLENLFSFDS